MRGFQSRGFRRLRRPIWGPPLGASPFTSPKDPDAPVHDPSGKGQTGKGQNHARDKPDGGDNTGAQDFPPPQTTREIYIQAKLRAQAAKSQAGDKQSGQKRTGHKPADLAARLQPNSSLPQRPLPYRPTRMDPDPYHTAPGPDWPKPQTEQSAPIPEQAEQQAANLPGAVTGVFRAEALSLRKVDLSRHRPSAPLLNRMPASFWLRHRAIPWVQLGDTIAIAFASEQDAVDQKEALTACFGPFIPVLAPSLQIFTLLQDYFKTAMARQASYSVPPDLSSRTLFLHSKRLKQLLPVCTVFTLAVLFPLEVFSVCCGGALVLLLLFTGLKLCGLFAYLLHSAQRGSAPGPTIAAGPLPTISVLVPLYKEAAISSALLKRLARLTYPQDRMEVFLVLEEEDTLTKNTIKEATLPPWMSALEVPAWGDLRTKPRAMNYALNYCRGDIIGVWDAEDAPEPDQLHKVAAAFAAAPAEVACFQGVLDYYNPRANWISRSFTLEYASWFRIVLQGIAKLDLVVPLGGTTMFMRRAVLDSLGGWDAHNVTEDADLGVRLYRAGYRTRMLKTATYEEASCTVKTWIRQRSRWLKGLMATYLVHMRHPLHLAQELAWRGFLGFQAFFLGAIGQFLLAPFLWTYWLVVLGLPHPSATILPDGLLFLGVSSLLSFELLGMGLAALGAIASGRANLAFWVPVLPFYYLMGPIAVYKALYELLYNPFYWDKTSHGMHPPDTNTQGYLPPEGDP